jgi:hypothetical protein
LSTTRLFGAPLWRFFVQGTDGRVLAPLEKRAASRTAGFTLNAPAVHAGQVAADDPVINLAFPDADSDPLLHPNIRQIVGLRREFDAEPVWQPRFAGLIWNVEDSAGDAPTSTYTAYDPWKLLYRRPVLDGAALPDQNGLEYTGVAANVIALELLGNTIAANGDVFIDTDSGTIETCPVVDYIKFDRGLSVGEAWDQLVAAGYIDIILEPIYDPDTRPGVLVELNMYVPPAGQIRNDAVFAWDLPGRSVVDVSQQIDGEQLANVVQGYAGLGGTPVTQQRDTDSITKYGEYWSQIFTTGSQTSRPVVEALALAQVRIRANGGRSISFDPAPERSVLSLRDYHRGDYVPLWASRNLRQPIAPDYDNPPSGYQRVYGIPLEIRDDGVEQVRSILTSQDTQIAPE